MSRPSITAKALPVTFHLPTGEKVSLHCQQSDTFREIKDKIWAKKNLDLDRKQCYITIKDMELLFQDDEHFSRMVNFYDIYKESAAEGSILKAAVVPAADVNDKAKRTAKKPTENGNYVAQGILYKRGSSKTSMFKKRYFVLEGFTLFYFESESAFVSNEPATDFIPMGGCSVVRTEELYKNKRVCFELHAEHLDRRNFSLAAESEEDLQKWFNAFYVVNFRRVKTITIHCVEALLKKNALEEEGIFRLSGSQSAIQQLKAQYDAGDFPNLAEVKDCHSITGLMKLAIRELAEPILTFARYPFFVDAGNADGPVRVERIKELIDTLPQSNKGILAYLMHFVNKAATFAETSKMAAKNLAIVFAPNLLRPQVDTVNTMNDTQNVLAVIQTMIEHAAEIWPETHVEEEHDSDSDDERAPRATSTASASGRKTPPISPRTGARPPPLPSPQSNVSDHVRNLSQNPAIAGLNASHLRGPSAHALPGLGLPRAPPPLASGAAPPAEAEDDSVQMSANPLLSPRSAEAKGQHAKGLSGGMMMGGRNMLDELKNKQNRLKSISGDAPIPGAAAPPPASAAPAFRPPPPSFPPQTFGASVPLPAGQPPRTSTPTPSAPATATVSGFELMLARKQQEDLLALWEKNYNERKAALNKAWSAVSAALAAGGDINAEIFEHLKSQLNDTEQLQQKATSDFDKNVALLNSLAESIIASKQAPAEPVSRPRLESMPPPPPPRHEPRKPSVPPPLPAGIQSIHAPQKVATAQFDYTGGHRVDELTFKEGAHVEILIEDTPDQPGWWQGRIDDKVGWFPASYVTYSS